MSPGHRAPGTMPPSWSLMGRPLTEPTRPRKPTMDRLIITDVSPRDGLQNQPKAVSAQDKLRLIDCLVSAGVRSVEATSFVSPKAVPQMADASEVLSALLVRQPELRS